MNRYVWALAVLLSVSAGVYALSGTDGSQDLQGQIMTRVRTTLEQSSPGQHQHAGHTTEQQDAPVICGVRVYGFEPAGATALTDVRKVYAFHMCGVAETGRPWDVAVKLAGPVILNLSTDPPGIQAVEATAETRYVDRLRQMFPPRYADLALKEALTPAEMTDLRTRYDTAAGL